MKRCNKCGNTYELESGFYKHKHTKTGYGSNCKNCIRAKSIQWKAENHERHLANNIAWVARNPEKVSGYRAARRESSGPELVKYHRAYYEANRDHLLSRAKRWQQENRDQHYANLLARKARKKNAFVERVRRDVLARRAGWKCGICGDLVTRNDWTVDHIIPLSRGGEHSYANTQIAHLLCNIRKGTKMPEEMLS